MIGRLIMADRPWAGQRRERKHLGVMSARTLMKQAAFLAATVLVAPALASFRIRAALYGADRALQGSSQALGLIPGIAGQYLRRAFYHRTLDNCDASVTIEFGTLFSAVGARLGKCAYIGPHCHIGLAHIGQDVLIGPAVHVPSGASTHGSADLTRPMREQEGTRTVVHIGDGCWIGSSAIVMSDVGAETIIGAGAVVTRPMPGRVMAAGVPARVIRNR